LVDHSGPRRSSTLETPRAAGWHAQQYLGTAPAVVEVDVPAGEVLDERGESVPQEWLSELVRLGAPELSIKPVGDVRWIGGIETIRRTVDFRAVAGLLRIPLQELEHAVDAVRISRPRPGRPGESWTWFEDELPSFVPRELLETPI
jgi:hypothetical protein